MALGLFGVYWVTPKSQGQFGNRRDGIIRKASPHCVLPCIWRERNARSFEDIKRRMPDIVLFKNSVALDLDVYYGLYFFIFNL